MPRINTSQQNAINRLGTFYGIGVGPGDPELLTLKAFRLIQQCDVITFLGSKKGRSIARDIAAGALESGGNPNRIEQGFVMPMTENRVTANTVYDEAAATIASHLQQGKDVGFLCQGDPFFFGSFAYLHKRLSDNYNTIIVPGISSINASAALTERPLALLAENIAIISGRRSDQDILDTLNSFDNVAIMKPGIRRAAILNVLENSGRSRDANYIEYAGQSRQKIVKDVSLLDESPGPYFSLFLVNHPRAYRSISEHD